VEILSPSTASTDLTLKKQLYERAGVPEYWIADPDTKRIDQYLLQGGHYHRAPAADPITTLANQLTIQHTDIW
jgi:Uma2 family endonuclease